MISGKDGCERPDLVLESKGQEEHCGGRGRLETERGLCGGNGPLAPLILQSIEHPPVFGRCYFRVCTKYESCGGPSLWTSCVSWPVALVESLYLVLYGVIVLIE